MFWNKQKEVFAEDLHIDFAGNGPISQEEKDKFLHPRFTAEEAYEKSQVGEENRKQKQLDKAFEKIKVEVDEGSTRVTFFNENGYDLDLLNEELPKLGYGVTHHDGLSQWLVVSWDKPKSEINNVDVDIDAHVSEIDPDKSYILPIVGTLYRAKGRDILSSLKAIKPIEVKDDENI